MQRPTDGPQFDRDEIPPEVRAKPKALIGAFGLDTVNNAVHRLIWEMCNSAHVHEHSDAVPLTYRLIGNSHEFPVVKPKRNSYEWYIPKGILKRNWMNKHLYEVPAVIAVFYDLEWDDPQWNEKMIECASKVQSIRAAIEGRSTQIVVVLIQDKPSLPVGEDPLPNERAVALCASCELNAKSLFILPHRDHLQGYIVRLELSLFEIAKGYYHAEVKNVKSHEKLLNRTIHQYLIVRHYFKMGFLNQMGNDNHTAHKNFTYAYNYLAEIRIVDTNATEIRTVAGFINYKLCRLLFLLGLPRDAINQFRTHTDMFKSRIGFRDLAFEHHTWMSQQFSIFADTFDDAVKSGLPAVQTQHPGMYYQQAAEQAILRKKLCAELCQDVVEYPGPDPLENIDHMEFYGQRPWRPGKHNADMPNPQLEARGIQALQYLEKQVNHSRIIISLYDLAIGHFKRYKCPRMRRYLAVVMADEYYNCGDYNTALTLYAHMLTDYGTERWYQLITDILRKALKCAYLTVSLKDFLLFSFQLLSPTITTSTDEKTEVYQDILSILERKSPHSKTLLADTPTTTANAWVEKLSEPEINITLETGTNDIIGSVDAKSRFVEMRYQVDQPIEVEIFARNTCPFALTFAQISVVVGFPEKGNVKFEVPKETDFHFEPGEARKFRVQFAAYPSDIGKMVQINSINLHLGEKTDCGVDFTFTGLGREWKTSPDLIHFRRNAKCVAEYEKFRPHLVAAILPRRPKMSVTFEHAQPALVNEWYQVTACLTSEEAVSIENLKVEIPTLIEDKGPTDLSTDKKHWQVYETLPINLLTVSVFKPADEAIVKFYVRCHSADQRNVVVKVSYVLQEDENRILSNVKEDLIRIPVEDPFEITTTFSSLRFGDISKFYVGEPFVIMPNVKCRSSWPIKIVKCALEDVDSTSIKLDLDRVSPVDDMVLQEDDEITDIYTAEALKQSEVPVKMGRYSITWKRQNGLALSVSHVTVMGLAVSWTPLAIELPLPEYGLDRTPLLITYKLYNRSQQLIQLELNMDSCEAFMFAGYRQIPISILPYSSKVFHYNLYPLLAGNVKLPRLSLVVPEGSTEGPALRQDQLNSLIERAIPTHIFIMPQARGLPQKEEVQKVSNDALNSKTLTAVN